MTARDQVLWDYVNRGWFSGGKSKLGWPCHRCNNFNRWWHLSCRRCGRLL